MWRAVHSVRMVAIAAFPMIRAPAKPGHLVVGWGWMLWDFNWFRKRNADDLVPRLPTMRRTATSS